MPLTYNNGSLNVYHTNTQQLLSKWREKLWYVDDRINSSTSSSQHLSCNQLSFLLEIGLVFYFHLTTTMIVRPKRLIGEITNWTASTNIASVIIAVKHLLWRKNANQVYKKKQVRKRMLKSAKGRENYKSRTTHTNKMAVQLITIITPLVGMRFRWNRWMFGRNEMRKKNIRR